MTPASPSPDARVHGQPLPVSAGWHPVFVRLDQILREERLAPERVVVLVPYAQLMETARRAWASRIGDGFPPRFESSRNWASTLEPFLPGPTDLGIDMARDTLIAASLLEQVMPERIDASLRSELTTRLIEAARQLAPVAAARPPAERAVWSQERSEGLVPALGALRWESLIARLALAWAGTSAYATDALWSERAAPGRDADALIVLDGLQPDPLAEALAQHWAGRCWRLSLLPSPAGEADAPASVLQVHRCHDAEDEAQRAAACVLQHLQQGGEPVALVANDRLLTRRVSALLAQQGVPVRDETGWKLSTTRSAAALMAVLRAARADASMDEALDALRQSPLFATGGNAPLLRSLEQRARERGVARWSAALAVPALAEVAPPGAAAWLASLTAPRPLVRWLTDLRTALEQAGMVEPMALDTAGQQVMAVLRLSEGGAAELAALGADAPADDGGAAGAASGARRRMGLASFSAWVRDVLESAVFHPHTGVVAAVVVLPLPQLLGRRFGAVVAPGCDELHLPASPELPGPWTAAQREHLGLMPREALAQSARHGWHLLRDQPCADVLWRQDDRGEARLPSPWLQQQALAAAPDPRPLRQWPLSAVQRPQPTAADLLPQRLSASAYTQLRQCPYRFFALRQLRLSDAAEIDDEPDARDLGNWLHRVLRRFHEDRRDLRPGRVADRDRLDALARDEAVVMGLNVGEGGAGFLPFEAQWPQLREGYLDWLTGFEAPADTDGPRFEAAEIDRQCSLGRWTLIGQLDRIDRLPAAHGGHAFVIDYKTEGRSKTIDRKKHIDEDVQLAFYAALLPDQPVRAAYLSITDQRGTGEKAATWMWEHPDLTAAADRLLAGIRTDLERIAAGAPLPALGESPVCDHCEARGLCRKDFWS